MKSNFKNHGFSRIAVLLAVTIHLWGMATHAQESAGPHKGVIYRNPRVYNVEYTFEMFPDSNKTDRDKDLKLWIPIPREWDSQKAVSIVSVEPEPQGKYVDPEYGNPMLFWDFGKEPEKPSYKVHLKYRLEQYEVHSSIDPNQIGPYDKTSKDYVLYTRSTDTVTITDKVRTLAKTAVGDETNPYLQAKLIYDFVRDKMYYGKPVVKEPLLSAEIILSHPVIDPKTGQEHYLGACYHQSMVFVALCRAIGIPARSVFAWQDTRPWIRVTPENPEPTFQPSKLSILGLTISFLAGFYAHAWAEVYLPNYGWVPVDPTYGRFGNTNLGNKTIIITKGRDVQIDPQNLPEGEGNYRAILAPLHESRADLLLWGVFNSSKVRKEELNHPDPFPADALAEYMAKLYPETEAEKNLGLYRRFTLRWIDEHTREHTDKAEALTQAYKTEARARYDHEAFICHMLRKIVGDKKFFQIVETYTDLRVKSGEPVSTAKFQKIAEEIYGQPLSWFFKQWIGYTELPQLQLDGVEFSKDDEDWHVRGALRQLSNLLFRLPVELVVQTEKSAVHKMLWVQNKDTDFEFHISDKPKEILIDPNNDIISIRKMPPLLKSASYDEIAYCTITDQDKADCHDWTALHFAAQADQRDIVEYLITHGADVKAEDIWGRTPLQLAVDEDHKDVAELLIEHGADFSLDIVTRLGNLARVKRIIDEGASVNLENRWGETALHAAAAKGHTEIAEFLIAHGADVDANKPGYTPLVWAVWNDDPNMTKLLVTHGADVNFKPENDDPAFFYCIWNEDGIELAKLFVSHGARLEMKDNNGWTVLQKSVQNGNRELVEFFVSKGAASPEFHLAACMGNLDRVKGLVEEGLDVDTKDELGWTPLYWAASMGREEVAEFLIGKGADIDIKTSNNRTLLHQAAQSGAAKLVGLLISRGTDVNARAKNDSTPLHSAAAGGHRNIVELLLANGAEAKAKEKSGDTPLHKAARAGHADVVEILLAHGADINAKGRGGRTALQWAEQEGHTEIVELLRKHRAKE